MVLKIKHKNMASFKKHFFFNPEFLY